MRKNQIYATGLMKLIVEVVVIVALVPCINLECIVYERRCNKPVVNTRPDVRKGPENIHESSAFGIRHVLRTIKIASHELCSRHSIISKFSNSYRRPLLCVTRSRLIRIYI